MRPFHATTFVITFIFKMFSQQQFSLEFRHFLVLSTLQLKWNIHYTVTASQTQSKKMEPVAKQDSSIANSVAESLSNVAEKSLHASSKESPAKLFHGAAHRGARSPQLPEGGVVPGCDVTMKRDLKEIAVQLDNLNVPVMGFVFNFAKERKVSSNGNYHYYYDESCKKSQRSRKKSKHKN